MARPLIQKKVFGFDIEDPILPGVIDQVNKYLWVQFLRILYIACPHLVTTNPHVLHRVIHSMVFHFVGATGTSRSASLAKGGWDAVGSSSRYGIDGAFCPAAMLSGLSKLGRVALPASSQLI